MADKYRVRWLLINPMDDPSPLDIIEGSLTANTKWGAHRLARRMMKRRALLAVVERNGVAHTDGTNR
jgi:hypothetical protein